jgi:hypothetical protein
MGVKNDFFQRDSFVIVDGLGTRFWEDVWLGNSSFSNSVPNSI